MTIESTQTESTPTTTTTTAPLTNGSASKARTMVPVTPEFWEELRGFLEESGITAMDLKRAGVNYNTARKISWGAQPANSVSSDYMMVFMDMVNEPEKYKRRIIAGAVTSISEMMNLNLTSN